jgi:hypothetical protein
VEFGGDAARSGISRQPWAPLATRESIPPPQETLAMDAQHFDALIRSLTTAVPRRTALAGAIGAAQGGSHSMAACAARQTRSVDLLTDRRTAVRAVVAAGLTIVASPRNLSAQETTPSAQARFAGETFVGETSDPETLVAIVLSGAAESEPRQARGYLCNGSARTIDVWLTGEARDDLVDLAAEDGSRLAGVLNAAGIGGGATLPDGSGLVFTALPATGLAGLYTVAMRPDGTVEGGSAAGATLIGTLVDDDVATGEGYRYDVSVTTPDGRVIPMTFGAATTEEGEFRLILLADGRGEGQGKTKRTGDWVDPDVEP